MSTITKLVATILSLLLFNTAIANAEEFLDKKVNNKPEVWHEDLKDDDVTSNFKMHSAKEYYDKGTVFAKLKKYNEAIENFNLAIKYKPDLAESYQEKGKVLQKLGKVAEATELLNKAKLLQK
ncbi:tetratricopeptide repeat protein [Candidatus Tisiphia endosymbiont of Nemotelus uliginosus]|uniref:tetratricopeptide repeat protein n=1 Tax=Candidatus Tisiphia endosymbiont of Nemotelus uliginosus TaxID=3077926 RepID=UPI0035C8F69B